MDESLLGIMEILGPVILLIVLVWLVMRRRSTGKTGRTEQATAGRARGPGPSHGCKHRIAREQLGEMLVDGPDL